MIKIILILGLYFISAIESKHRKCLFPDFITNNTNDGLNNCYCAPDFEYDENYGICFRNKCEEICGDQKCVIKKPNLINFQYLCYCPINYVVINQDVPRLGCTPLEYQLNKFIKNLPKNPLFHRYMECKTHTYELVGDEYKCSCLNGYEYDAIKKECILMKKCTKLCGKNQICAIDNLGNSKCECKIGFGGQNCENHFCDWKTNSFKELTFIDLSIKSVCGSNKCLLDKNTNQFKCDCGYNLINKSNGLCEMKKPCLKGNLGYKKCTEEENKLCSIRPDHPDQYRCSLSLEQGGKDEYTPKFNRSNLIKTNFKISMEMRLNWFDGRFYTLFLNQMNNLVNSGAEKKLPGFLYNDFIKYERSIFWDYEEIEWYEPQLKDKLLTHVHNGLKSFHLFKYYCANYTVYPQINYDENNLKMNRLIETVFDVDYLIYCQDADKVRKNLTTEFYKELKKDYVENYYYLKETGFIYPNSIKIDLNYKDDDKDDDDHESDKKYKKCLRDNQESKFTTDGIRNCTCKAGFEFDTFHGVCFENKCSKICKNMNCAIIKHLQSNNENLFDYHCYCPLGSVRIGPYNSLGCKLITDQLDDLTKKNKYGLQLPTNPFLLNHLQCDHKYKYNSDSNKFECHCHRGWKLNPLTNKCSIDKEVLDPDKENYCNDNQIINLDEFGRPICTCKAGFGGFKKNCKEDICNFKSQTSPNETNYLYESVEMFCGRSNCDLVFDEFRCKCLAPFTKNETNNECELEEICTPSNNYGNCGKGKFCKILTNNRIKKFECKCSIEEGDMVDKCIGYDIDNRKYCLPGFVDNGNQLPLLKCVKGKSTFDLNLKIRLNLNEGNNAEILLNNYLNLEDSINLNNVPIKLIDKLLKYRENSLDYSINKIMNKLIIKDKLQDIIRDALIKNYDKSICSLINPIVKVNFDENKFNLFRIIDTLIDTKISITCANQLSMNKFLHYLKLSFKYDHVDDIYYRFNGVGFVIADDIRK